MAVARYFPLAVFGAAQSKIHGTRMGGVVTVTTVHAHRVTYCQQGHFGYSIILAEQNFLRLYCNCAGQSDFHRNSAEFANLLQSNQ